MTDQPAPPPAIHGGVRPLDLVATAILVVGGVLTIGSTFAPVKQLSLGRLSIGPDGQDITLTVSVWGSHYTGAIFGSPDQPLQLGIPLIVGAILMIIVSLLALPTGNNRRLVVLRPLSIGAAGLLIGTIWTVAIYFSNLYSTLPRGIPVLTDEAGWPLLLAAGSATGLGLIVALVSFWYGRHDAFGAQPPRPPRPTGDVVAYAIEPDTPPYGIPLTGPVADTPENPPSTAE